MAIYHLSIYYFSDLDWKLWNRRTIWWSHWLWGEIVKLHAPHHVKYLLNLSPASKVRVVTSSIEYWHFRIRWRDSSYGKELWVWHITENIFKLIFTQNMWERRALHATKTFWPRMRVLEFSADQRILFFVGFSDLVDFWVIKIKKPMILCARCTSRSREQCTKRR